MAAISSFTFNANTPDHLLASSVKYTNDWPVVYILDNDKDALIARDNKEAYVGETLDASVRASQHWQNPERRRLTRINIISDEDYNKSVILDLEAFLIKHMSVDRRFHLQNGNMGLHLHNYYNRAYYEGTFRIIWDQMREMKLADKDLQEIENSDLFKYSPFNSLSADQYATIANVIHDLNNAINLHQPMTAVVQGGPGTGKTVLAVQMMKLLTAHNLGIVQEPDAEEDSSVLVESLKKLRKGLKVALVIPMQSLRETLRSVFDSIGGGLGSKMILSPNDVPKDTYDLLVVDEAHRLRQRKGLAQYPIFDKNNELLGFDEEGTELDWILKQSKYQIFFYDSMQSVKPADVDASRYTALMQSVYCKTYKLHTQFRCLAGDEYIQYIRDVLSYAPPSEMKSFDGYELGIFDDAGKMADTIKAKNAEVGLSRMVAGYAWKWVSKKDKTAFDISLDGRQFQWNTTDQDWVNSTNSVNEIGCIHTIQGYDLNYAAIIFGYEIDYDWEKHCFSVDKTKYQDGLGKCVGKDKAALEDYILNIYKTMLTRGICGTYVYACNSGLRKYLKQYFPTIE